MKKLQIKKLKGFTLVELIIVITILSILATIAFVSFQGYTKDARDGNRLATLNSIEKGVTLFQVKSGTYPEPDEKINIEASGTVISYQGVIGENVSRNINISKTPTDPLDNIKYVYSTNKNQNKYQLMSYMEGTNYLTLVTQIYADNLSMRKPKSIGDNVGILLKEDNSLPTTTINTYTGTTNYKILFQGTDSITSSGNTLFSNIYNRRDDLMNNPTYASLDDSLVGYWDMETLTGTLLKDLSGKGNDGTCYNSGTIVNCDGSQGGPQRVDGEGTTGKAMSFDGVDDYIYLGLLNGYNNSTYTVIGKVNIKSYPMDRKNINLYNSHQVLWSNRNDSNNRIYFFASQNTNFLAVFGKNNGSNINLNGTSNTILPINDSSLIAFSVNNNDIKIYYNGYNVHTDTGNILNFSSNKHYLGINTFNEHKFDGTIDEVRIYNRALSDSEIKELYNATK